MGPGEVSHGSKASLGAHSLLPQLALGRNKAQQCGAAHPAPELKSQEFQLALLPVALLVFILEIRSDYSKDRNYFLTLSAPDSTQ